MIVSWVYDNPVWLVGLILVGGAVLLSCLGLAVFHRFVDHAVRRDHNDIISATIGVVGTVAAILLAFIAVATWETFSHADDIAGVEANAVGNLYADAEGLPGQWKSDVREHIRQYLVLVIDKEWPEQQKGELSPATQAESRLELRAINKVLADFAPETLGQAVIHGEMLRTLNELYRARRTRILASSGHVPPIVWDIILLGTAATIGYTYLFGMRSFRMHLAVTASVTASLSLVILLIVALDYPFRGELSVGTDSYESVRATIDADRHHKAP